MVSFTATQHRHVRNRLRESQLTQSHSRLENARTVLARKLRLRSCLPAKRSEPRMVERQAPLHAWI